jgi:hypothetical protein
MYLNIKYFKRSPDSYDDDDEGIYINTRDLFFKEEIYCDVCSPYGHCVEESVVSLLDRLYAIFYLYPNGLIHD